MLELVHTDVRGKHSVETKGGIRNLALSANDIMTRMRWVFPITKDKVVEALEHVAKNVADPEDLPLGRAGFDGVGDFECPRGAFPQPLLVKIETNPPYVPQRNALAECTFGAITGITRSLLMGAQDLPQKLWREAATTVLYMRPGRLRQSCGTRHTWSPGTTRR